MSIRDELSQHLASEDGTPNDDVTEALYRRAHSLPEDAETDLEEVERWAWRLLNR